MRVRRPTRSCTIDFVMVTHIPDIMENTTYLRRSVEAMMEWREMNTERSNAKLARFGPKTWMTSF